MNWSTGLRQFHRWTSVAFVATVIMVSVVAAVQEEPAAWVFFVPLLPLAILTLTGLYLFVLPYATNRRGRRLSEKEPARS